MKLSKSLVLVSLLAIALTGCTSGKRSSGGGKSKIKPLELTEEQQAIYNEHYQDKVDCFGNEGVNYDFINKVGFDLIKEIHKYFIDQHKTYVRYSEVQGLFRVIDKNSQGKIELFYTGRSVTSYTGGTSAGTQNREHVWPCERSGGLWYRNSTTWEQKIDYNTNYWGGGSDLFHIRPADAYVNTVRSNSKFYQFKDGEKYEEVGEDGGSYNIKVDSSGSAKFVEVDDTYKGDVARLLAYLYVHYVRTGYDVYYSYPNGFNNPAVPVYSKEQGVATGTGSDGKNHDSNVCGLLNLPLIIGYKDDASCIELLKNWNNIDAPSETEKMRNDSVQKYQKNRNPFVDFPQLIERCFG